MNHKVQCTLCIPHSWYIQCCVLYYHKSFVNSTWFYEWNKVAWEIKPLLLNEFFLQIKTPNNTSGSSEDHDMTHHASRIMIYKVTTVSIFLSLVHFSWETLWFKQIQQENSSRWYSSGPSGTEWRREATTGGEISGVTGPECSVSHWCCVRTHGMWFIFYSSSGFFMICFLFNFALFHW